MCRLGRSKTHTEAAISAFRRFVEFATKKITISQNHKLLLERQWASIVTNSELVNYICKRKINHRLTRAPIDRRVDPDIREFNLLKYAIKAGIFPCLLRKIFKKKPTTVILCQNTHPHDARAEGLTWKHGLCFFVNVFVLFANRKIIFFYNLLSPPPLLIHLEWNMGNFLFYGPKCLNIGR